MAEPEKILWGPIRPQMTDAVKKTLPLGHVKRATASGVHIPSMAPRAPV